MATEESAGAVIFYSKDSSNYFLILKYTTYWGFSKGNIEKGESPEQAAVREIKEETNLDIKFISGFKQEQRWFYQKENKSVKKHCVYFISEISEKDSNNIKISDEHEDFKFVNLKESKKYIRIKQNIQLLENAEKFINSWRKQRKLFSC